MRIAVASSGLGHVARGIESWADDLGRSLASRGEDVRLCKASGPVVHAFERVVPRLARDSRAAELVRHLIPSPLAWRLGLESGYGVEQASFALGLLRVLRREAVDVLHVQDPWLALIAQGARRIGLIRTRTVLAHGTEERPEFLQRIRYLQHLAPWHLDQAEGLGIARETWTSIPNFIDTQVFHPSDRIDSTDLGIPPEALVVLCVAAIQREHKRIDHLILGFARLIARRPDLPAVLVVAGAPGADTDSLIAEARAKVGDRARFLVGCPRSKMPGLYQRADVFVLASLKEMMPIALLEAMSTAVPCLVHHHPVLTWIVGDGGRSIDMESPENLAEALAGLLDDPDRRQSMGASARSRAQAEFAVEPITRRILDYYASVRQDGQPGAPLP